MKQIVDGDRVALWVCEMTGGQWLPGRGSAIGLEEDGRLIAGVIVDAYNGASACMHVAAVPGARWLNREYLFFCFAYVFNQLKVNKVIGLVESNNAAARRFDEHLGFVHEATLKDAAPGGDLLLYTMTRDQCPWLNLKVEHGKAEGTPAA